MKIKVEAYVTLDDLDKVLNKLGEKELEGHEIEVDVTILQEQSEM